MPDGNSAANAHALPRILVAGPLATFQRVASVLRIDAEFFFAQTIGQALHHVEEGVCLVVCSERFDESRMFNFLHALHPLAGEHTVAVICCREAPRALSPSAHQTIALALEALGIRDFLDMPRLRLKYGGDVAEQVLRALMLERLRTRCKAMQRARR